MVCAVLSSCEKVINVDLNDSDPKYVIEGNVTNAAGPYTVRITQSKNFSEDNTYPGVSGAVVTISDDAGNTELLQYKGNGNYETSTLTGVEGRTYQLKVEVAGQSFSAKSYLPPLVNFDSLYMQILSTAGDSLKMVYAQFKDVGGIANYYRHVMYVNGEKFKGIYISDDPYSDGQIIRRPLPYFGADEDLMPGDSVEVEMQCIDAGVYQYFYTLDQTISQNSATPANPQSNISGGALGYFSAHTVQRKLLIVP